MTRLSNNSNIPLPLAVWLATDEYDFVGGVNKISATSLLKPVRRHILTGRVPLVERENDVADFIASKMGTALHDSIEKSWKFNYQKALAALGYPQSTIDLVRIDPVEPEEGTIPIYLEKRSEREVNGFTISGKFDMVVEGELYDTKSTSVYSYIFGNKIDDWVWQGSFYKFLNPTIVTGDHIHIQNIFTDWSRSASKQQSNYPPSRLMNNSYELKSMEETEQFIIDKTNLIRKFKDAPDADIPFCTDEELWRSPPKYKYFSDPEKTSGRSTKNFDNPGEAHAYRSEKGKGVVITELGKVKACSYCPAFKVCEQRKLYDHDGD